MFPFVNPPAGCGKNFVNGPKIWYTETIREGIYMTQEQFEALAAPFWARPRLRAALLCGNRLLTYAVYLALLIQLWWSKDPRFWRVFLTPAFSFLAVSLFRDWYNQKRPYEEFGFSPLIPKNTRGHSFPSRHVFSVFVIALAFWSVLPWAGALLCGLGVLLAILRVVGGVHYPRDVAAGAAIGILCGLFGCVLF